VLPAVLLAVVLLVATACNDAAGNRVDSRSSTTKVTQLAAATLAGSGATLPQSYYEAVIAEFQSVQLGVTLSYAAGGSRRGQTDLQAGLVQWAGSDLPIALADEIPSEDILVFPTVAAPITIPYNLPAVERLRLSADTIAAIFAGTVTKWDDEAIATENPSADLPGTTITVVHRAEASGTTANLTRYLTAAAPDTWTLGSGDLVAWPGGQRSVSGSSGVTRAVKSTVGAIGYVDLSDARVAGLALASIQNAAGNFVAPNLSRASDALEGVTLNADLTYDPTNASGARSYPITAPTYILVSATQPDPATGDALRGLLDYIYGPGQPLARQVDYVKLPANILRAAKAQIDEIVVP
jgi:phosphate transport system substrate-binding protein